MAHGALALLEDPALWSRFSADCRRRAEQEFPTDALVSRYRALYEATLAG
jgi:glycosyltransferase involved in cell wall biosynthesis